MEWMYVVASLAGTLITLLAQKLLDGKRNAARIRQIEQDIQIARQRAEQDLSQFYKELAEDLKIRAENFEQKWRSELEANKHLLMKLRLKEEESAVLNNQVLELTQKLKDTEMRLTEAIHENTRLKLQLRTSE